MKPLRFSQAGQAMTEFAIYVPFAVVMTLMLLSWIPLHRSRTMATAAAYGCAQFLSQSPDPGRAARNARRVAQNTLESDWSATLGVSYSVSLQPPAAPGDPGSCRVTYQAPILFNVLGLASPKSVEAFVSRSESWKSKW